MSSIDPTRIEIKTDPTTRRMRGVAIHGDTPFDVPFISQITDDLWTGGCENGMKLPFEIKHLVSLYPWEAYTVFHDLESSLEVRLYDDLAGPNLLQIVALGRWVNICRQTGPVLVHCQAGLNRSNMVAATALMLEGMDAEEAIALLRDKRSPAVLCNPSFEEWLRNLDLTSIR